MRFSILVPVYNVEKYLEQSVDSLLSQTYTENYEIILVDDGSTDNSGRICDDYAAEYRQKIRVIHKKNQGLISSRDVGIKEAVGDYCVFVDSDDFVESNLLSFLDDEINKNCNPDVVVYSLQYYNDNKIIPRRLSVPDRVYSNEDKNEVYNILISSPVFKSLCTKAVKTEILKNDKNDYSQYYAKNMGEDWLRSIHIFTEAETIVSKDVALYNYRMNLNSISHDFSVDKIDAQNTIHVYNHIRDYLSKWKVNEKDYVIKLKTHWLNDTMYIFSQFYENAKSKKAGRLIVDFDWDSFLPKGFSLQDLYDTNTVQCKLYEMIKSKKYLAIELFFLKKTIYKNYKKIKSKVRK